MLGQRGAAFIIFAASTVAVVAAIFLQLPTGLAGVMSYFPIVMAMPGYHPAYLKHRNDGGASAGNGAVALAVVAAWVVLALLDVGALSLHDPSLRLHLVIAVAGIAAGGAIITYALGKSPSETPQLPS